MFVCLFVCLLPFFSPTAEPFALKLGMVLWNDTGKTAKHFGVHWMHNYRVIAYALCDILGQNSLWNWNSDVTMPWFHLKCYDFGVSISDVKHSSWSSWPWLLTSIWRQIACFSRCEKSFYGDRENYKIRCIEKRENYRIILFDVSANYIQPWDYRKYKT